MSTTENAGRLQVTRFIKATPERVFAAWTTPGQLQRWFGPRTCRVVEARVDLRVGGAYSLRTLHEEHGEITARGEYREITAPSRLVFTWSFDDDPDWAGVTSVVTVELAAKNGGTQVTVTHDGLPSGESASNHTEGWQGSLDKLEIRAEVMAELNGPGQFSWNELLTTDVEKAGAFYTQLFGWATAAMPGGMPYTLFKKDGLEAGGMMKHPAPDAPPSWLAYVTVSDIDASSARVKELGGTICKEPFEIPQVGRIAIAVDPQGAGFGLFQPGC